MPKAHNIMIHEFEASAEPRFDEEGDQMLGFYYQFTDAEDQPVSALIGPYGVNLDAERAALRALRAGDF